MKILKYIFCLLPLASFSQQSKIDSLLRIFNDTTQSDTVRLKSAHWLIGAVLSGSSDLRFRTAQQMQELALIKNQKQWESTAFMMMGLCMRDKGNYPLSNDYYLKALKIKDETGNAHKSGGLYMNIAKNFFEIGDMDNALKYSLKILEVAKANNNKIWEGIALENIAGIYLEKKNYTDVLKFLSQALDIFNKEDKGGIHLKLCLLNMAEVYSSLSEYSKALEFYFEGLKLQPNNNGGETATAYSGIAKIYLKQKKYSLALQYANDALKIASTNNFSDAERDSHFVLYDIYKSTGSLSKALEHYEKYISIRDTLISDEKLKEITRKEMNYEFDKKEALANAHHEKEIAIAQEEKRKQKIITYSVSGGLFLVLLLALLILRGYRQKQKANKELGEKNLVIEKSKHIIEEKNKDITDSINYARRIQRAMLPHRKDIWEAFPQSFVLYKPKDIVSGDFYFFHQDKRASIIAAADCTGHGVPGAFMSLIASEKLKDAVQFSLNISEVLAHLNKGIKTSLKQSGEDDNATRDGMDIALCSVDTTNRVLKYAGANRPIWIIRKGSTAVEEIKATKKAIGGFTENSQQFETHEIQLNEGDSFYLSTDGYADTFGKDGKKMMTKRFKEILLGIQDKTMKEQEKYLDDFVENWKAGTEQVDDILVIGIRL